MKVWFLILTSLVAMAYGRKFTVNPVTIYKWKKMEFGFRYYEDEVEAEASGNIIPENAIPIDVQPVYDAYNQLRTIVTIPKFMDGIPYSLATISYGRGVNGPILTPYPNYESNQNMNGTNCDAITSAFRVAVNECNQMWIIDSGFEGTKSVCPPQLVLIDLNNDQIIHRYRFPKSLYTKDASLFINFAVNVLDNKDYCADTMVYVADVNFHGLVVYSFKENRAWRIENRFMFPDPNHGLLTVANKSFVLMDGIFGLATDKKNLYFHPMASTSEFFVPLDVIHNSNLFENNVNNADQSFVKLGERTSPCPASAMDSQNNIYCVTLDPIELIKWNVGYPYASEFFTRLPIEKKHLEFTSGIKVFRNADGREQLWMLSNKFQDLATGTQNFNEINFRILIRYL